MTEKLIKKRTPLVLILQLKNELVQATYTPLGEQLLQKQQTEHYAIAIGARAPCDVAQTFDQG